MKFRSINLLVAIGCLLFNGVFFAQSPASYDALVQQGKTQLQAGNNDAALASANAATKLDTTRWEAYAVAAGALINLKRCDDARASLDNAIKRAPAEKQAALRALSTQCVNSAPIIPDHADAPAAPSKSQEPSLIETTDWIMQKLPLTGAHWVQSASDYPEEHADTTETYLKMTIDKCTLRYTHEFRQGAADSLQTEIIPLGAITEIEVNRIGDIYGGELGPIFVSISADSNAFTAVTHQGSGRMDTVTPVNAEMFIFGRPGSDNEDLAHRMAKALAHARDLCRNSFNPHPGEPF